MLMARSCPPASRRPGGTAFRLVVEESTARYPLTIDPIAQQAYLKASNTGAGDRFGFSVAVSGGTVVIGAPYARFSSPTGAVVDIAGNLFVTDSGNHTIRKITLAGLVTTFAGTAGAAGSTDGSGSAATFNNPTGIAIDISGNLIVADSGNHTLRKITAAAVVSTLAGTAGAAGSTDSTRATARFNATPAEWQWTPVAMPLWRTLAITRFAKSPATGW